MKEKLEKSGLATGKSYVSFLIDCFHVTSSLSKIQNKSQRNFYPYQAYKAVNLYQSALLQLNSMPCLETSKSILNFRAMTVHETWL